MNNEILTREHLIQIFIASFAMSLAIAAIALYAGHSYRQGRVINSWIVACLTTAVGFFGTLGALWGLIDLWIAILPAAAIGPMTGVMSYRLTRPDVLAVTAYLGRRSPTN